MAPLDSVVGVLSRGNRTLSVVKGDTYIYG